MQYQFRTMCLQVSFIALTAYLTAMPHEAYAASGYYATCMGGDLGSRMLCGGLTSNTSFSQGNTVTCNNCGTYTTGTVTYKCAEGEAGGRIEGFWEEVSRDCEALCSPNSTESCTTSAVAAGTRTCGDNMLWGRCVPTSCKSGYVLVPGNKGNHCYATCTITNGAGYMYDDSDTDTEESSSSSTTA